MLSSKPSLLVAYKYVCMYVYKNMYNQKHIHTKSKEWNQNVIIFLVDKNVFSKIYIIHISYTYVYKSFSTMLDKVFRKNIKRKRRDGEIGKYKLT